MGLPAAKFGDTVDSVDTHVVLVAAPGGAVPVPMEFPFSGKLTSTCSPDVLINGRPAAVVGSVAVNVPPHVPVGGTFAVPPTNVGTVTQGSPTVFINGLPAARAGDTAATCNDPVPLPLGKVVAVSNVLIG